MKNIILLFRAALGVALLTLTIRPAEAQYTATPPGQMTYQGFLTDASGVPFGSSAPVVKTVNFRLWTAPLGGVEVWGSQQFVTVDKGYFSVLLGQGGPIGSEPNSPDLSSLFTVNGTLYLETQLADSGTTPVTLAPRLAFQSAPYAFLSKVANQLSSSDGSTTLRATTGGYTLNGSLTASSASVSGAVSAGSANVSGAVTAASFTGNGTIPVGGIIMWSGSAIPAGWALCNGQTLYGQTTPNLTDKFVVGSGNSYAIGNTGGASSITLSTSQIPAHTHSYGFAQGSSGAIGSGFAGISGVANQGNVTELEQTGGPDGQHLAAFSAYAASTGGGAPIDNRPPYYALAYIMRVQ